MGIKDATNNALKISFCIPCRRRHTVKKKASRNNVRRSLIRHTMKSCAKVVAVFFVLCAIHACLAKPKWLWFNEDVMDDLELEADDAHDRQFNRGKPARKLSCQECPTSNCYNGKCIQWLHFINRCDTWCDIKRYMKKTYVWEWVKNTLVNMLIC